MCGKPIKIILLRHPLTQSQAIAKTISAHIRRGHLTESDIDEIFRMSALLAQGQRRAARRPTEADLSFAWDRIESVAGHPVERIPICLDREIIFVDPLLDRTWISRRDGMGEPGRAKLIAPGDKISR